MTTRPCPTQTERAVIRAHDFIHQAADAQRLADHLFKEAEDGCRASRRMLHRLHGTLVGWGASVPEPTWPPIWHRSRRAELVAMLEAVEQRR